MKKTAFFLLFLYITFGTFSTEYYVSPSGSDTNPGTLAAPFKTVLKAFRKLNAGDVCYLREGRYHEEVAVNQVLGTAASPITIQSYPGERAVLDGTVVLDVEWSVYKDSIYKTVLTHDITQLFVNDTMMMIARWPNAFLHDGTVWDQENHWAKPAITSTYGTMIDNSAESLAMTGLDFTGAVAVMNVGHWKTFPQIINSHTAGSNEFTYTPDFWTMLADKTFWDARIADAYYYIEGKLECLDAPGEFYYDPVTKELYLYAPNGDNPTNLTVRGKTLTNTLRMTNSGYITIKDIDFFGGTFKIYSSTHITFEDCNFTYPSYSKRVLKSLNAPEPSLISYSTATPSENVIRNCVFKYTDGPALKMTGLDDVVENCLFHDIDISGTGDGFSLAFQQGKGMTFRRNTIYNAGSAQTVRAGMASLNEYNHIFNTGLLQHDGAGFQFASAEPAGSIIRYNWIHDISHEGIRFDGGGGPAINPPSSDGLIHHNVCYRTKSLTVKGDKHQVYNNLSYKSVWPDIVILDWYDMNGVNINTITKNNASEKLERRWWGTLDGTIPGISSHNYVNPLPPELINPDHLDFRPVSGSALIDNGTPIAGITDGYLGSAPDNGPYEYGMSTYRIPGRQSKKSSMPIPPDRAQDMSIDTDLMWLGGYEATGYKIYLGTHTDLTEADYQGTQSNNIFRPNTLAANATYYWRVDTITSADTVEGDVWTFYTEVGITPTPTPGLINIAKGKPIHSSSRFNSSFSAQNANDALLTTVWGSAIGTNPEWIYIDLGNVREINGVGLKWFENYYATSYEVYLADTLSGWKKGADIRKHTMGDDIFDQNISVRCRYIGIYIKGKKMNAVGLKEFEIYCKQL